MRRPNFRRCNECRRNAVTHRAKLSGDTSEAESQMAGDVLEEAPAGSDGVNMLLDDGPEVSWVVGPFALTRDAKRLARIPANDAVHASTPRCAVKGSEIRPHRRRIQISRLHARCQDFAGVGFDLHIAHCASASKRQSDAEVEAASATAEGENVLVVGT